MLLQANNQAHSILCSPLEPNPLSPVREDEDREDAAVTERREAAFLSSSALSSSALSLIGWGRRLLHNLCIPIAKDTGAGSWRGRGEGGERG